MKVEAGQLKKMQSLWAEQRLKAGASVKHCIVAENVVIGENAVVGAMPTEEEQKELQTIGRMSASEQVPRLDRMP